MPVNYFAGRLGVAGRCRGELDIRLVAEADIVNPSAGGTEIEAIPIYRLIERIPDSS